jgi:glyoxylase-like metal-dependent hydrolase (beta-lactamase superfamily II)
MNIETWTTGYIEENCYFASNPATRETVVIDPGDDAPQLIARLKELNAIVVAYLLTHGHVDHVTALAPLAAVFPAPIYVHPLDAAWCFTAQNALPGFYDAPAKPKGPIVPAVEGPELELAGARWSVVETPGHTPGGICWRLEDDHALFSGDTLFRGSVGRTDLPGGDARTLTRSLRKLAALPDNLTVYSGHGEPTTIAHEKKHNYFMQF